MVKYENFCCNCDERGMHCQGNSCVNINVPVYYCDNCGEEMDEIYDVDGLELCESCTLKRFRRD